MGYARCAVGFRRLSRCTTLIGIPAIYYQEHYMDIRPQPAEIIGGAITREGWDG